MRKPLVRVLSDGWVMDRRRAWMGVDQSFALGGRKTFASFSVFDLLST